MSKQIFDDFLIKLLSTKYSTFLFWQDKGTGFQASWWSYVWDIC